MLAAGTVSKPGAPPLRTGLGLVADFGFSQQGCAVHDSSLPVF